MEEKQRNEIVESTFKSRHFNALFTGAVSGVISRTATSPLERIKIIKQVNPEFHSQWGTFQGLQHLWKTEGWNSLWKGNGVNALRIAPYNAVQLASFYKYKEMFGATGKSDWWRLALASSCAGMTSVASCYPLDTIRSVLSIQTEENKKYANIRELSRDVYKTQGVRGFYKGLNASLIGIVPYVGINLALFDTMKQRCQPDRSKLHFDLCNFALGGASAMIAVSLSYPFEVTRRRLQLSGMLQTVEYKGISECISKTYKQKGIRGFYSGLVPCFLRVIPAMSIVMVVNERMRELLEF
jgi:Mitochondrial carrier protein